VTRPPKFARNCRGGTRSFCFVGVLAEIRAGQLPNSISEAKLQAQHDAVLRNGPQRGPVVGCYMDVKELSGSATVNLRGGADKSLVRPTSRCRKTDSIVSLESEVCSCAELQVFSCYRGLKEAC